MHQHKMDESPENINEQLLTFFKAMADANRLKIIGLLAQKPHSVEELAAILDLRSSTVSHHLSRLAQAGLVSARAESYYNMYQLDKDALEKAARTILSPGSLPAVVGQSDASAYERKVLSGYLLEDGSLQTIPAQRKKLEVVLRHIVQSFDFGKRYPEVRVNQILSAFHEDTARLRRELVGYRLLTRESGEYWRLEV
jgi:predicted transcriptional regulator